MSVEYKESAFKILKNVYKSLLNQGYCFIFFVIVFLIFRFQTNEYLYIDIFTQRDILRALGWLKGNFHWPGPEMSSGGNLPGPFFYFLLFPPLLFGESIYSQSLIWLVTWLSLTWTMAFCFASKFCKHKESLVIFLMFFISSIGDSLFLPTCFAWNAAFAIIFHILAIISLYYWILEKDNKNFYLYFFGIIIGLGIQIHFEVRPICWTRV